MSKSVHLHLVNIQLRRNCIITHILFFVNNFYNLGENFGAKQLKRRFPQKKTGSAGSRFDFFITFIPLH